jgi:alpha-galactosidase
MDLVLPLIDTTLTWGHDRLACVFDLGADGPVSLVRFSGSSVSASSAHDSSASDPDPSPLDPLVEPVHVRQPLVELFATGSGHRRAASRLVGSVDGARLRYLSHTVERDSHWTTLRIRQTDVATGTEVTAILRSPLGVSAVTVTLEVRNYAPVGSSAISLEALAVAAGFGVDAGTRVDDLDLISARNDWLAESRWQRSSLRAAGLAHLNIPIHGSDAKGSLAQVSTGSWSTEQGMPVGGLVDRAAGLAWIWQVETNGAWRWEVGERSDGAYVALSGPNSRDHEWTHLLEPGATFTSVPVTLAVAAAGFESALAELTGYRRAARRSHADNSSLPVVFNDYMNTLMGDPSTAKLMPLIDAAQEVGAEVFVIDAGWYDESGDWWDSVGEWLPSSKRFPGGLGEVITRIRSLGMIPGLWLEPEVVGVKSPVADRLPDSAFLQRGGIRIREHDRYHLDLRSPAARVHLDEVIDRLVNEFGIGYFKLDYNINAGPGTDLDSHSIGDGLLGHNRAHLVWLDAVLDRHPGLILENCASGAMRMDFAMLSRLQLQSTSDQQDPLLYPPIAASAPLAMLPEQAANWAYPQPGMSAEDAAFTLSTAMLGRFYLSGYLNQMSAAERGLVAQAIAAHSEIADDISHSTAFWPLGLPGWTDVWIALGLVAGDRSHLSVWRRPGSAPAVVVPLPHLAGHDVRLEVVFPRALEPWRFEWDRSAGLLTVVGGDPECAARTITITRL